MYLGTHEWIFPPTAEGIGFERPHLSGLGFKILLDILATARHPLRVAEVPYSFRDRFAGESKLDEMAIWEYGMLLADKTIGRFVPVRFLTFSIIRGLAVC